MLSSETKRKIDSARNILVGNVTNPISQVDQITNALIYKFMDDMDMENLEVDLKPQFFVGEYEQYSWRKLMDKKLSGQKRFNLYEEATKKLSLASHIPQLFRTIFENARLPYNDPRVLTLFLKEINDFSYSHSEELGNAFEYLLSILGSQGDAGQFRTPRHIIDFIAEVIDPKKNETILDPACGTAGFLISAYKHILKDHDGLDNKTGKLADVESPLTPDERNKLMNNIVGYEISPDMVKLSLVNMYLHGFQSPKIYKYDTLSSEKRWGDTFDVILANPPFMTPRGGIRPHKKFSIQANRAEVLFTDYIMEHLSINGRAGIIVPEGIIFKSDNAYKALRKKLVEDGLYAVVSLPSGVFNPYSGVKTSILFIDRQLAKLSDEILFVRVLNDGFDLGAQRRPRPDLLNDLFDKGGAIDVLKAQSTSIQTENINTLAPDKSRFAWAVKKERIAESGDYNLTGERYREVEVYKNKKWPMVELGDANFFLIESGGTPSTKKEDYWNGEIAWITLVDLPAKNRITEISETARTITKLGLDKSSAKLLPTNSVLVSSRATIGRIAISRIPVATNQGFKSIVITDQSNVIPEYLANVLTQKIDEMLRMGTGGTYKEVSKTNFSKIKIPLPPLEVQKKIVEEIEVKQNAIDAAREVIKNLERERRYFGQELRKLEDVEWVELGEVAKVISGQSPESKYYNKTQDGLPFYQGKTEFTEMFIGEPKTWTSRITKIAEKNDILMSVRAPVGPVNIATQKICIGRGIASIHSEKIEQSFLFYYLKANEGEIKGSGGAVFDSINRGQIEKIEIPFPPIEIQKQLVAEAEKEEYIIKANKNLIEIMKNKIEKVISEI